MISNDKEGETMDETFRIASMKIHEDWKSDTFENDIAVLLLKGKATW